MPGMRRSVPGFFAVPRFATNGEKYRLGSFDREAFWQMCRTMITDVCIVFTHKQEWPPRGSRFRYKLRMGERFVHRLWANEGSGGQVIPRFWGLTVPTFSL